MAAMVCARREGTRPSCPSLWCVAVTLVLGGVRSGKSRYAESLLSHRLDVTYVAAGARPADPGTDPEWAARVRAHQHSRRTSWRTRETTDLVGVLAESGGALLIDCLGTWITALIDRADAWEHPTAAALLVQREGTALIEALQATDRTVVVVSNEVGLSLVPVTPSGRVFQDELGRLNAAVADVADRVVLVVAGRVLELTDAPRVPELSAPALAPQDRATLAADSPQMSQTQDRAPQDTP